MDLVHRDIFSDFSEKIYPDVLILGAELTYIIVLEVLQFEKFLEKFSNIFFCVGLMKLFYEITKYSQ